MTPTFRQLQYFLALAESGQISRAALQCHVSQSSMTTAMKGLEEAAGAKLFSRHRHGVRLTEAGTKMLWHAQRIQDAMADAMADVNTAPTEMAETLRIGVTETITGYLLPTVIQDVSRKFPGLEMKVVEDDRAKIESMLLKNQLDFAVLLVSNLLPVSKLAYETALRSRRQMWSHPEHPLVSADQVTLADIAQYDYVLLDMDEHLTTVQKYWAQYRLTPKVRFQSRSIEGVRSLVAAGQGLTILSDLVYRPWSLDGRRLVRRPVADKVPSMDAGLVWNPKIAPSSDGLLVRNFFRHAIHATDNR